MTKHKRGTLIVVAAALVAAATAHATPGASRPAPTSVIAQAHRSSIAVYRSPNAVTPFRRFSNPTAAGAPLVFLVKQRGDGWEKVYLPARPNGATGWVRDRDVELSLNPYQVVVALRAHTLTVFKSGRVIERQQAGVGRTVLPTPHGLYYITELLKQPDATGPYGPYAFGLSAHSNVLYSFGGGSGQIGIHGTNEPWALGSNVSHGCIRITNAAIAQLARMLPLGTPVRIVS
jgi:lipoprotein-anchoring transpeptidase ErfK/SrfK